MPGQSRKQSLLEAFWNTLGGFVFALLLQIVVFPIFNVYLPFSDNFEITAIFTIASIIRSYAFRRLFNHLHMKQVL